MAVNKVVFGTETLLDLTGDTVTVDDVAEGVTFHGADGVKRSGTRSSAPAAHASTHATGGSDPITPASIGAAARNHTHTPGSIGAEPEPIRSVSSNLAIHTITLRDHVEDELTIAVTSLTIKFPASQYFDSWLKFTTSSSSARVTFPEGTTFIGGAPTFEPNKTYEMSIKDGCVVCAEVVSA